MIKNLIYIFLLIIIFGCSDVENTISDKSNVNNEIDLESNINLSENIDKYIIDNNKSLDLTIEDYKDANIKSVTADNILYINANIKNKKVTSRKELQELIYNLLLKIAALEKIIKYSTLNSDFHKGRTYNNDDSITKIKEADIPNIQDYLYLGIIGIDKYTILEMNNIIYGQNIENINSSKKLQELGNKFIPKIKVLHKIYEYVIDRNKNPSLTVLDYQILGLSDTTKNNIKAMNASILTIEHQNISIFSIDNIKKIEILSINSKIDSDKDGYPDSNDFFPLNRKEHLDTDKDGIGDNEDLDDDNDGIIDIEDAFPFDENRSLDTDKDGIDNSEDLDDDNDGIIDIEDDFPLNPKEHSDTDKDGIGNSEDLDDDNDGIIDIEDDFPLNPKEHLDTDKDGIGDNEDLDDDNDGITDLEELEDGTNTLINENRESAFFNIFNIFSENRASLNDYKNLNIKNIKEERLDIINFQIKKLKKEKIIDNKNENISYLSNLNMIDRNKNQYENITMLDLIKIIEESNKIEDIIKPFIRLNFKDISYFNITRRFSLVTLFSSEKLIEFDKESIYVENATISTILKKTNFLYTFIVTANNNVEGNIVITLKEDSVTDLVGNGNIVATISKKIDTIAPEKLNIPTLLLEQKSLKPLITGNCNNGDTVIGFINKKRFEPRSLCKDGKYSITPINNMEEGIFNLTVRAEDSSNNISSPSPIYKLIIDTISPIEPTIDIVSKDNIINSIDRERGVIITGTSENNSTVFLDINNNIIQLLVDLNSSWRYIVSENMIPATSPQMTLKVYSEDLAKNRSTTVTKIIKIILTKPTISINQPIMNNNHINYKTSYKFNMSGRSSYAAEGEKVIIKVGDIQFSTHVDKNGNWNLIDKNVSSLADGYHTILVKLINLYGNNTIQTTANIKKNSLALNLTISDDNEGITTTNNNLVRFNFLFSEDPINFTKDDIIVENGIKSNFIIINKHLFQIDVTAIDNDKGYITVTVGNNIYNFYHNFTIETIHKQEFNTEIPKVELSVSSSNAINNKIAILDDKLEYNITSNIDIYKPILYIFNQSVEVTGSGKNWIGTYYIKHGDMQNPIVDLICISSESNGKVFLKDITHRDNIYVDGIRPAIRDFLSSKKVLQKGDVSEILIKFNEEVQSFTANNILVENGSIGSLIKQDDNITYIGILTPDIDIEDISNRMVVKLSDLKDLSGNIGAEDYISQNYIINTLIPKIISIDINAKINILSKEKVTVEFNKNISNFNINHMGVPNGTISLMIQQPNMRSYEGFFTPFLDIEDDTNKITVFSEELEDYTGAAIKFDMNSTNYSVDTKYPTVISVDFDKNYVNTGSTINLIVKFSEPIKSFTKDDIFLLNGSLKSFAKQDDNITYIGIFTPQANIEKKIYITIKSKNIEDLFSNPMPENFNISKNFIDTINPKIRYIDISNNLLRKNENSQIIFKFSEQLLSFTVDDIISPNASIINLIKLDDNLTYTALLIPNNDTETLDNKISLKNNQVMDMFHNPITEKYFSSNYTVQTITPTILSVELNNNIIIKNKTAQLTVKFNKEVMFFDSNFILSTSGMIQNLEKLDDNITYIGTFVPYEDTQYSDKNIITISNIGLVDKNNDSFIENKSSINYKVDTKNPTIVSIILDSYRIKENTNITIKFSEKIKLFTIDNIISQNGIIELLTTDDNQTFTGIFVPNNKIELSDNIITIDKEGIKDLLGNPLLKNLSSKKYSIDTTTPRIVSARLDISNINATSIPILTVEFSEKIKRFPIENIITDNGSIGNMIQQSDPRIYKGRFFPEDRIEDSTNMITILGVGLEDLGGNSLLGDCKSINYIIDNINPEIESINLDKAIIIKNQSAKITFKFTEKLTSFDIGSIITTSGTISNLYKNSDNVTYTAIFTPKDNIEYLNNTIIINSVGLTDILGNSILDDLESDNYIIDTANPEILSFSITPSKISKNSISDITISFSEKINQLSISNFISPYGIVDSLTTKDSLLYKATFTPYDNVEKYKNILTINIDNIEDIYKNSLLQNHNSNIYNIDTISPVINSIDFNTTIIIKNKTAKVTVLFSEEIEKFNIGNILFSNGEINSFTKQDDNLTYVGIFTPNDNIDIAKNSITVRKYGLKDLFKNPILNDLKSTNYLIDTINPKILSISLNKSLIKKNESMKVEIKFSEEIISFTKDDLIIENGAIDSLIKQDDNITYIGYLIPSDNLSNRVNKIIIKSKNLKDFAGNFIMNDSKSSNYIIDTIEPEILSIDLNKSIISKNQTATVTIKLNKELKSFGIQNLIVQNGSIDFLKRLKDKVTFTGVFTPIDNIEEKIGSIVVKSVNLEDLSGNFLKESIASDNYIVDTLNPEIISVELDKSIISKNQTAQVVIKFSEEILLFDNRFIIVEGGTVESFIKQSDNITYIGTFTPKDNLEDSTNIIIVENLLFQDLNNNFMENSLISDNYEIDTMSPIVLAFDVNITKIKKGSSAKVTIKFSEEVLSFDIDSLIVESGIIDSLAKQDDNITYIGIFTPNDGIEDFNNTLTIKSIMVEDLYSNILEKDYKSEVYGVDTIIPTLKTLVISSVATHLNMTTYIQNEFFDINLTFSEEVSVGNNSYINIEVGDSTKQAIFFNKHMNVLQYRYIIVSGDADIDGISIEENQISGKIVDNHGNIAILNHNNIMDDKNSLVNTESAKVIITSDRSDNFVLNRENSIIFDFTFDRNIIQSSFTIDDIEITNGTIESITAIDNILFRAVANPFLDLDLTKLTVKLKLNSVDTESFNTNEESEVFSQNMKTSKPSIINVTSNVIDGKYKKGKKITIEVMFNEKVFIIGSPLLELETGSIDVLAKYQGGSGGKKIYFNYTISDDEFSEDLNYKNIDSFQINSSIIKDFVGNSANPSLPAITSNYSLSGNKDLYIDSIPIYIEEIKISNGTSFVLNEIVEIEVIFAKELVDLNIDTSNIYARVDLLTFGDTELVKLSYKTHRVVDNKTIVTFTFPVTTNMRDKNGIIIEAWKSDPIQDVAKNIFNPKIDRGFQFPSVISRSSYITNIISPYIKSVEIIDNGIKGSFEAGDIIRLMFNQAIQQYITTSTINLNNSHNFGSGWSVRYKNSNKEVEIILGSNPTITTNDKVTIPSNKLRNIANEYAIEDAIFTIGSIKVPNFAASPLNIIDNNKNLILDSRDEIIISFNKPIKTNNFLINSITSNNNKIIGENSKFYSKDRGVEFSQVFILKLGNDSTLKEGDTLTFDKNSVKDASNSSPSNNLSAKIPFLEQLKVEESKLSDNNSNEIVSSGDTLIFKFNRKIKTSLSVTNIRFNKDFLTTTNASISAINDINGFSNEFKITFNVTFNNITTYDVYINSFAIFDEYNLSPENNILFTINDIVTPKKLISEIILDDKDSTMSYTSGDILKFSFTEPIDSKAIDIKKDITLSGGGSLGDDAKIISLGLTNELKIKLSDNLFLPINTNITFNKNSIIDSVGNIAINNLIFTIPSLKIPRITKITIPDGNYISGDKIKIEVHFSKDINIILNGANVLIKLKIGVSIVKVLYEYSTNNSMIFIYYPSGVIDLDGIDIIENSMNKSAVSIKNGNIDANIAFSEQYFKNVKVNSKYHVSNSTFLWLDGADVDGYIDDSNYNVGDSISVWRDKSGNNNHMSQFDSNRQPSIKEMSNGLQYVYLDGNDHLIGDKAGEDVKTLGYIAVNTYERTLGYLMHAGTKGSGGNMTCFVFGGWSHYQTVVREVGTSRDTYLGSRTRTYNLYNNNTNFGINQTLISGYFFTAGLENEGFIETQEQKFNIEPNELYDHDPLSLGSRISGSSIMKGDIREFFFYSTFITDSIKIYTQNYLASKWDIKIKNDLNYFSGDTGLNENYDFNVGGLLKTSSSEILNTLTPDKVLSFSNNENNPFITLPGDSLFIGSKGDKDILEITDVPILYDGTRGDRLNLSWYLDPRKNGGVIQGSIDMSFDLDKIPKIASDQDKSSYILLYKKKLNDNFIKVAEAIKKDKNLLYFENISILPENTHLFDDEKQMKLTKGYFTLARYIKSSKVEIGTTLMGDNIVSKSEQSNVVISGEAFNIEDGEKVSVTIGDITTIATINNGRWSTTFNLSNVDDGDIDIEASIKLTNGLPVDSHKFTIQKDTEAPSLSIIYDITGDNRIDSKEKELGFTINGVSEANSMTYLNYNSIDYEMRVKEDGTWSVYIKSSSIPSNNVDILVYVIDKAGNQSLTARKRITISTSNPIVTVKDNSEGVITNKASSFAISFTSNVSGFAKSDIKVEGESSYSLSGSGATYTLTIIPLENSTEPISIDIPEGVASNNLALKKKVFKAVDTKKPTVESTIPVNDGRAASSSNIVFNFSENIVNNSGVIKIYKSDNTLLRSINISDSRVKIEGKQLIIELDSFNLEDKESYIISIMPNGLKDNFGNVVTLTISINFSIIALDAIIKVSEDNMINQEESSNNIPVTIELIATSSIKRDFKLSDFNILFSGDSLQNPSYDNISGIWSANLDSSTITEGEFILDVDIRGTSGESNNENLEKQIIVTVDRKINNFIYFQDKIYKMPIIHGKSEDMAKIELEISLDNDGLYDDGFYTIDTNSDGTWIIDLEHNKPNIGVISKFTDINNILSIRVKTIDKAGNTLTQLKSSEVILSLYSISNGKIIEGDSGLKDMIIKIYRDGDLSTVGSVLWKIDEKLSTARENSDFSGYLNGVVIFEKGEDLKEFKISISGDYLKEHNDKIVIKISDSENGVIEDELSISEILELDSEKIEHIFSLTDMNYNIDTPSIRVRRLYDDSEKDIGFDEYGNLDREDLLYFINYDNDGSKIELVDAKGFVTTFYNQNKNNRNMVQENYEEQPYIVESGDLILNSDETVGIKFEVDDSMYIEESTKEVTNLEIFIRYQYLSEIEDSLLFNLNSDGDRVSARASEENGKIYWDSFGSNDESRLTRNYGDFSSINTDLAFTANYTSLGDGSSAKNRIDSKQAIFMNGEVIAYDGNLREDSLTTGDGLWRIGTITDMHLSQFIVYQSEDNKVLSKPSIIHGTKDNDTINFNGESNLVSINGGEGIDTVYIANSHNLNDSTVNLKSIEYIDMRNRSTNNFTSSNDSVMKILMDEGDTLNNSLTFNLNRERVILGSSNSDTIYMSIDNEVVLGQGGKDTYIYNSWDRLRVDGTIAIDTFKDIKSGDKINLSNLFYLEDDQDISDYLNFLIEGTNIRIEITEGAFSDNPYQIIIIEGLATNANNLDSLTKDYLIINDKNFITLPNNNNFTSSSILEFQELEDKYAYDAYSFFADNKNISPALDWNKFHPSGTNSYAIIMEDITDGSNEDSWIHWNVLNISLNIKSLAENWSYNYFNSGEEDILQLTADSSENITVPENQYVGPWPTTKHKYQIKIYALKDSMPEIINNSSNFNSHMFEDNYIEHIIDFRTLTFTYTP